jgi:hypothetical protein
VLFRARFASTANVAYNGRMFRSLAIAAAAASLAGCSAPNPAATPGAVTEIAGRIAGPPRRCVSIQQNEALRPVDPHTLLYAQGRTIYVNRLAPGCVGIHPTEILIVQAFGSQYCAGDVVRTQDPLSRIPGPSCVLREFIPYTRP